MKKQKQIKKFHLISLGCAKNSVDSRSMAGLLDRAGLSEVERPGQADVIIVNTCGFISPAREESLYELRQQAKKKKNGQLLIAAGCLSERDRQQLVNEVQGIDGILSTRRWMDILALVQELETTPHEPVYHLPESAAVVRDEQGISRTAMQGGSAYLKIGDGCDRLCAFCAIPLIKGPSVSRSMDNILRDAVQMQAHGIQELILISQDTTSYGRDLGMQDGLPDLVQSIVQTAPQIPWIRMMYAFPGAISDRLIRVMAENNQVLPYLDLPLQHAVPQILKSMKRPADMNEVRKTIRKIRTALPTLALRTTFIVGYPGEGENEFNTLLDFVKEIQFDRIGIFPYFFEFGTPAESLGDPVPAEIKEERIQRLAEIQEKISLTRNQRWVGEVMDVLIEGVDKKISIGRSFRDAPEIDGLVIAEGQAKVGEIVKVQINGALVHDLAGVIIP